MTKQTYQANEIMKDFNRILKRISGGTVEFYPKELTKLDLDLIAYKKNGCVKYLDVTKDYPDIFLIIRDICNALDDYCVEQQFMTSSQLHPIKRELQEVLIKKETLKSYIKNNLNRLSEESHKNVVDSLLYLPNQTTNLQPILFNLIEDSSFIDLCNLYYSTEIEMDNVEEKNELKSKEENFKEEIDL